MTGHLVDMKKFDAAIAQRIFSLLEQVQSEILGQLKLIDPTSPAALTQRVARMKTLSRQINGTFATLGPEYQRVFAEGLKDVAAFELGFSNKELKKYIPSGMADVNTTSLSPDLLERISKGSLMNLGPESGAVYAKDWLTKQAADVRAGIQQQIQMGVIRGEGIDEIARRIKGGGLHKGVIPGARNWAKAFTRTSVTNVMNDVRKKVFEENSGKKGPLKGLYQVSALDKRTTPVCVVYAGARWLFGKKGGELIPVDGLEYNGGAPRHVACRSIINPWVKSWEEMGLQDSKALPSVKKRFDGKVPARLNGPNWFAKQPAATQNAILGKGKAQLYRDGEITLGDVITKSGGTRTLKELTAMVKAKAAKLQSATKLKQKLAANANAIDKIFVKAKKKPAPSKASPAQKLAESQKFFLTQEAELAAKLTKAENMTAGELANAVKYAKGSAKAFAKTDSPLKPWIKRELEGLKKILAKKESLLLSEKELSFALMEAEAIPLKRLRIEIDRLFAKVLDMPPGHPRDLVMKKVKALEKVFKKRSPKVQPKAASKSRERDHRKVKPLDDEALEDSMLSGEWNKLERNRAVEQYTGGVNVNGSVTRRNAKIHIADDLSSRMARAANNRAGWTAAELKPKVEGMIYKWADTSGDTDIYAVAMQLAARKKFGLKGSQISHLQSSAYFMRDVNRLLKRNADVYDAFLDAMYDATQDWFKERGITHVNLFRGAGYERQYAGFHSLELQPLSSFAVQEGAALEFTWSASGMQHLHAVRVPVEHILSNAWTGFGCLNEYEFVIMGKSGITALSKWMKSRYLDRFARMLDELKTAFGLQGE